MTNDSFPGPKTRAALERGIPLFKNGLRFESEMERAGKRGFRSVRQIVIDKAEGDFVWDLDGHRYIDFQNGWATNPLGNCHPEILEAVEAANRRFGFHYDHPLRYDLAEKLAAIMPDQALPRTNYEVSGTEAAEAAVHLALTHTKRRYIITFSSSYHGMGLGQRLLDWIESSARSNGYTHLVLQVNKNNAKAIAAYRRKDYAIEREVVVDIGHGYLMDDYVMRKSIA